MSQSGRRWDRDGLEEVPLPGTAAEVVGPQEMDIVGAAAEELELQEEVGNNDGIQGAI